MSQTLIKLVIQSKTHKSANRQIVRDSNLYTIGTFMSFILCLFICSSIYSPVHATDSSITIEISDPTVDLNVSPSTYGTFAKSGVTSIGVATTNYTGYTLKLSASNGSNPTALVNGSDSTNTLSSITSSITEEQFKALNGTSYNNMWGYLPSKYCVSSSNNNNNNNGNNSLNCSTNTNFLPSPTTTGDTLDITSTANSTANEYELTIGARVDTSMSLGAYTNTFLVEATANPIPYTITYIDGATTNMPVDVDTTSETETVTISPNTPTRSGYTFLGWCKSAPTVNITSGNDTCSNPSGGYQPGATISLTLDKTSSSNNFTLYAMWGGNYTISAFVAAGGTMQDLGTMSAEKRGKIIASMTTDTNYNTKDSRDNQAYTISRLKDGQVWMTKNLNIAGGTALESTQTDIPATYTLPTANGFQSGNKLPASSTTGFSSDTMAYVYNSGNTNCGTSDNSNPCYSYYSYITATAGSGASVTGNGEDAPWSICPKGWRLPTSGNHEDTSATSATGYKKGDFYRLATAYGVDLESAYNSSTTTFNDNLGPGTNANFLLSGYYSGSQFHNGGVGGHYWSSTGGASTSYARSFYFNTGYVNSASNNGRWLGCSVRCILK